MVVHTNTDRVRHSRKLVLELLGSSVDLSLASSDLKRHMREYGAEPERLAGATVRAAGQGRQRFVRARLLECVLCYKCVEACGTDAQNTFAIAVAGRGFDAHISTESDRPLPDSACVYCGNCIGVCPTGALMFKSEHDMRQAGTWDESKQTVTDTICPYCGVGCTLQLHVQDNDIVRVTSPLDHDVTQRPSLHQGPVRLAVRAEPLSAASAQSRKSQYFSTCAARSSECCLTSRSASSVSRRSSASMMRM